MMMSAVSGMRSFRRARVAQRGADHIVGGFDATDERPSDLGATVAAASVVYGQFGDDVAAARSLDEHLDGPAEGHLVHLQRFQGGATHYAERADITKTHAVQQTDHAADQPVAQQCLGRYCTALRARADA